MNEKPASAVEKVRGRIDTAKKAIAAVDWKAKFLFLAQSILLLALLALHVYATVDNFRFGTGVKWVCLVTTLVSLASAYFLFRAFGPGKAATVIFSLFIVPIAVSAVWFGGSTTPGYLLASRETGFWSNAVCLGTILVMFGWVVSREVATFSKVALCAPLGYCSLGFLVGIIRGAPLDLSILGTGFLRTIPFEIQPASLYLNVFLPLVLCGLLIQGLLHLLHGESERLPATAALVIFFLLPFIMGIATMNRYLIPNISFLVLGKPIGTGLVTLSYTSPWDEKANGSKQHEVTLQTANYRKGAEPTYRISASIIPPEDSSSKTRVKFSVKDRNGRDVLNLKAPDFTVLENDEKQDHVLVSTLDRDALDKMLNTSVVLSLDISGSMQGEPLEALRKSAVAFVRRLVPAHDVELITFESAVERVTQGFVRDFAELESKIQPLESKGGTSMYDSVFAAFDDVETMVSGRGIVVLFSDGADSGSTKSFEATMDRVKGKGIQMFTVGFGSGMSEDSGSGKKLKDLAEITGGKFCHADQIEDIDKVFDQIFEFISCNYEMEYQKALPPPPTVSLLEPPNGAEIVKPFPISADVKGRIERVEFLIDRIPVRTFQEKREGRFSIPSEDPEQYDPGTHTIIVRAHDMFGRKAEAKAGVTFRRETAQIRLVRPTEGQILWKDGMIGAVVEGRHFQTVKLFIDDRVVKSLPSSGAKYRHDFSVIGMKPGLHTVRAEVHMADGRKNSDQSSFKSIVPQPAVKILNPAAGKRLYGVIPLTLTAESGYLETALRGVTVSIDGQQAQAFASPPYALSWDTRSIPEGQHTILAEVTNELGATARDTVTVETFHPQFSATITGIVPEETLRENRPAGLSILNTRPDTTITKAVISIDDKEYVTLTAEPWEFLLDLKKLKAGRRQLQVTVHRSDGDTFVTGLPFVVQPPRRITVYFSVKDDKGRFIPAKKLKELPLVVKEDGKPVRDFTFDSAADHAVSFGLVMDVSGSMKEEQKLEQAKGAATMFVKLMKSNDKAFIIKFSNAPELVQELTGDQTSLLQNIEYLMPKQATALYDAVHLAVAQIREIRDRPAFVVLTDGLDQNLQGTGPGSMRTLPEVVEMARREDVQIFTIGLGRELLLHGSRGEKVLKMLSEKTGGSYFFAPSGAQLLEIFQAIIREVGSQAKLEFVPPSGANDDQWHTISIAVPDRKDLKFLYKPTYLAK